jgi:prepilin-type N-terminal cleavage/methylation domain-containing protein
LEENAVDIFKLNNRGFTLIEIAITIAVVGIIGVAFSGFFINSARIINTVDEREKAVMIAQQEMEELKARGYSGLEPTSNKEYSVSAKEEGFPEYNIILEIKNVESGLYKVELVNKWDDNKEIKLFTYISER